MSIKHKIIVLLIMVNNPVDCQEKISANGFAINHKLNELSIVEIDSLLPILKKNNPKEFALLSEIYVSKAIAAKKYEKALDISIKAFYTINIILGNPKRGIKLIEKTATYKEHIKDTFLLGMLELKRGGASFSMAKYKKAIKHYTLATKQFGNTNLLNKADAYFFRGQAYGELGNIKDAIESLKLAQNIYEAVKDTTYTLYTLEEISIEYERNGLIDKAIKIREEIINKASQLKNPDLTPNYFNLGNLYEKKGNSKKFEEALLKAYDYLNNSIQKPIDKSILDGQLAVYYAEQNNIKKAEYYLKNFINEKEHLLMNPVNEAKYHYLLAKYKFANQKFNEALKNINYAFDLVNNDNRGEQHLKSTFSELLSEIYAKLNKWDKAYYYSDITKKINDSIENVQKTNVFAYYQSLYETEKKDKEINQKSASITLLEKDNLAKRNLIFYGGSSLIFLLLLTISLHKRNLLRKEKKLQQDFSQKLLSLQEEERKRISKDLHDSLGQHLLFIKNNAIIKKDDTIKELITAAIEEMRNISRSIHPFQLEQMGITYTIKNLVMEYDENSNIMIFGDIENIDGKLKPEKEINLYRIIQECLTNMIKHSNAESGKVEVKLDNNKVIISVFDNGIGFNHSEKFKTINCLGLKTIKERLETIGGKMKIVSNINQGSQFIFSIPA